MTFLAVPELQRRLRPIDDDARNGRFQLVFHGRRFAVVRWAGDEQWIFGSGRPAGFTPQTYLTDREGD